MTQCKNQLQENLFIVNAVSIIQYFTVTVPVHQFLKCFTLYSESENVDARNYYIHAKKILIPSVVTAPSPFKCS